MGGFIRQMKLLGADSPERDVYETEYGLDGGSSIALKLHAKGYDGLVFGEDLTSDLLVDLIEKRKETAELIIMPELVLRETS